MATATRWTDQFQAERMASQATAQTCWTFTSVATMSATTEPAPTTSAVPTGPMSDSARVQSSRPTTPPGAKLAIPRPDRKRWARVATEAVRTSVGGGPDQGDPGRLAAEEGDRGDDEGHRQDQGREPEHLVERPRDVVARPGRPGSRPAAHRG